MKKVMPIQGIEFTHSIDLPFRIKHILNEKHIWNDKIRFCTYQDYQEFISGNLINSHEIQHCDSVAMYTSQSHNTIEVFNMKLLISAIYFSQRLSDAHKLKEKNINGYISSWCGYLESGVTENIIDMANEDYARRQHEFFDNYNLKGYWTNEGIKSDRCYIKLGNSKVSRDDFDNLITRGFSSSLCDEYDRQIQFCDKITRVNVDEVFLKKISMFLSKMSKEDECAKKLKSALRMYHNVMGENDVDSSIVAYVTILESLLLGRSEQKSQSILVPTRCACLIADEEHINRKIFIANIISCLYSYRNQIIHEGKTFLELDNEMTLDRVLTSTRHIIYLIIKRTLEDDIKAINEIIEVVKRNLSKDNIESGKRYITFKKGESLDIIYMDSE